MIKKSLCLICLICWVIGESMGQDTVINQLKSKLASRSDTIDMASLPNEPDQLLKQAEYYWPRQVSGIQKVLKLAKTMKFSAKQYNDLKHNTLSLLVNSKTSLTKKQALQSLEIIHSGSNDSKKSEVLLYLGLSSRANFPQIAYTYFNEAEKLYQLQNNWKQVINMLIYQGSACQRANDYLKSLECLFQALKISREKTYPKLELTALQRLAHVYQLQFNFSESIKYCFEALNLLEKLQNPEEKANIYYLIASVYDKFDQDKKALEYLFKALKIYKKHQHKDGIQASYSSITNINYELGNYAKAIKFGKKTQSTTPFFNSRRSWALGNMGLAYGGLKQYQKAIEMVNLALDKLPKERQKDARSYLMIGLGKMYAAKKDFKLSKQYFEAGIALSLETQNSKYTFNGLKGLYQIAKVQGMTAKALQYHEQYLQIRDSVLNRNKALALASSQFGYQINKKQLENEQLKQTIQVKQQQIRQERLILWLTLGSILLLVSLVLGLGWLVRKIRRTNGQLRIQQENIKTQATTIEQQKTQLETNLEQLQELTAFKQRMTGMIAHDIKNPLSAIIGLSTNSPSEVNQQTIHQSGKRIMHLVRNMLDVQKLQEAQFNVKTQSLHLFEICTQAIEQVNWLANAKSLTIQHRINEQIFVLADQELLLRVLVNLLHNAINYTNASGKVVLCYENSSSETIKIQVEDTGIGIASQDLPHIFEAYFHNQANQSSTGLGLTFCQLAIEAQGGKIGVESTLGKGSVFWLELPQGTALPKTDTNSLEQSETGLQNTLPTAFLQEKDWQQLWPYLQQLQQFKVYQLSEVNEIIDQIDARNSPQLLAWKTTLQQVVFAGDQACYDELVNTGK